MNNIIVNKHGLLPVNTFGNRSRYREGVCFWHGKGFWPFTKIINDDNNMSVALLGVRERSLRRKKNRLLKKMLQGKMVN